MHMAWMRAVTGRMKSDYMYSSALEPLAQAILDARAAHEGATLADLYDPDLMPSNVRKAHQALDHDVPAHHRAAAALDAGSSGAGGTLGGPAPRRAWSVRGGGARRRPRHLPPSPRRRDRLQVALRARSAATLSRPCRDLCPASERLCVSGRKT